MLVLYLLEAFVDRLSRSRHADRLLLKGGVLLAAFGEPRPTRDIDLQAQAISNDADIVKDHVVEIARVDGDELRASINDVAAHRNVDLVALTEVLDGSGAIGQVRWAVWRKKEHLEGRVPKDFGDVVRAVIDFADPAIGGSAAGRIWDPGTRTWR